LSSRARVFRRNNTAQTATTQHDGHTYANPHDQEKANEPEDTLRPNKLPSYNAHGHRVNHNGHRVTPGIQPDGESGRRGVNPLLMLKICWQSASLYSKWVNILWPFTIAALVLFFNFYKSQGLWIFITAYVGMVPAANLLGFSGQEIARKLPKVWGVILETTFGSIVEIILFMVLISRADSRPENIAVIRAAILGSILANLLFCLGMIAALLRLLQLD
jgi:Ca2+:H+ antiporter